MFWNVCFLSVVFVSRDTSSGFGAGGGVGRGSGHRRIRNVELRRTRWGGIGRLQVFVLDMVIAFPGRCIGGDNKCSPVKIAGII